MSYAILRVGEIKQLRSLIAVSADGRPSRTASCCSLGTRSTKSETQPNGFGVVFVSGSGWRTVPDYSATPLKQSAQIPMYVPPLVAAGYTVFTLNHRATPGFRYPEVFSDVQRAIRFIRYNAAKYGIDPDRLGGAGGSSGAHLLSLSATMDAAGIGADACTVTGSTARGYVSRDDPPFLLLHGDADQTVPFSQSQEMEAALKRAGVAVKLIRIEGADHGPDFPGAKNPPDTSRKWFTGSIRSCGRNDTA